MALTSDQIVDLVTTTQKELGRMRWTDIATDLQEHHALPNIMRKRRVNIRSGYQIQRNLQVGTSGAAKHTGLYAVDKVNIGETMKTASVPWRHTTVNYGFERREVAINRTPARIVELVSTRRSDAMTDLADLMERTWWDKPLTSADEITPWGIRMFIITDVANPEGAFTAETPGGFSDVAGLDPATVTRWRNWAFQTEDPRVGYTKDITIRRMRRARRQIGFKAPVQHATYERGKDRWVIYCNETSIISFEEIGEKQNENLGRDIASMDDRIAMRRMPIEWVPQLDGDTTRFPVYFIDWSVFQVYFLEGEYMREEKPEKAPNQHTTYRVFIDCSWNNFLVNRRKCAVGSLAA